ncbi:MAG: hypothetical protein ACFB11_22890 [Paracoccaceae bacterium]
MASLDGALTPTYRWGMVVLRNLPSQLILAHAPWSTGYVLIFFILAFSAVALALVFDGQTSGIGTLLAIGAVPTLMFALMVKKDQVILNAGTGIVTFQRRSLLRYDREDVPLADVKRADVEILSDTARPVLILKNGAHPLIQAFISGNGPRQSADIINYWLANLRSAETRRAKG